MGEYVGMSDEEPDCEDRQKGEQLQNCKVNSLGCKTEKAKRVLRTL